VKLAHQSRKLPPVFLSAFSRSHQSDSSYLHLNSLDRPKFEKITMSLLLLARSSTLSTLPATPLRAFVEVDPKCHPLLRKPRTNPLLMINVYDGTASLWPTYRRSLSHQSDGNQKQLFVQDENFSYCRSRFRSTTQFWDNYNVIVFSDGYKQAGFNAVKLAPSIPTSLDLMLIRKDGIRISRWRPGISNKNKLVSGFRRERRRRQRAVTKTHGAKAVGSRALLTSPLP